MAEKRDEGPSGVTGPAAVREPAARTKDARGTAANAPAVDVYERALVTHPWPPVYDSHSAALILGTIPSPKSLARGFYYGNPQNCFWRTLALVLNVKEPLPDGRSRGAFLLRHKIALWDVLSSCKICGARDSSISEPEFHEFAWLLRATEIKTIFATGKAAARLFNEYCAGEAGMRAVYLPSTSPANRAAQSKPAFLEQWRQVAAAVNNADLSKL